MGAGGCRDVKKNLIKSDPLKLEEMGGGGMGWWSKSCNRKLSQIDFLCILS